MRRLFHECHARHPQAGLDGEPLWRQRGWADRARQAVLLLRQRMGTDRTAHRHADHVVPAPRFSIRVAATAIRRHRLVSTGS